MRRLRHICGISLRNLHLHGRHLPCDYLFAYTLEWRKVPAAGEQDVGTSQNSNCVSGSTSAGPPNEWQPLYASEEVRVAGFGLCTVAHLAAGCTNSSLHSSIMFIK